VSAIEWAVPLRPRASLTCDAPDCTSRIEAYGLTFAEADEKLRRLAADAGWQADALDESFAEASRMMGAALTTAPGGRISDDLAIRVKRNDRCPACRAKETP
jgi:hypothetical protein